MTGQTARISVSIHRDGVSINGTPLGASGPPAQFHAILGMPDRILDGAATPAPAGHRNNQFHYYDADGVTLNEHHFTRQIQAITFVFDTGLADHPTEHAFHGQMIAGGVHLDQGTLERQLSQSDLEFTARLPGSWFTMIPSSSAGRTVTVVVSMQGRKLKSGRRNRTKVLTGVSLCLPHDPWDAKHVPEANA